MFFHHLQQSLTFTIFDGLSRISIELQRVLWNRRENQQFLSSISLQLSELTWRYIVELLLVEEHQAMKVNTFSCLSERDLSTARASVRCPCKVLRVEDREAILCIISLFGISSVVGIWKRHPKISRLKQNDTKSSASKGALKTDVINLIDKSKNTPRQRTRFKFNAEGRKGVALIYFPEQSCLKISVRYISYVLHVALHKLHELRIVIDEHWQALTDEELEELLNC